MFDAGVDVATRVELSLRTSSSRSGGDAGDVNVNDTVVRIVVNRVIIIAKANNSSTRTLAWYVNDIAQDSPLRT